VNARTTVRLIDTAGSTAQIPSTLSIVYDDGSAVPADCVRVANGKVMLNFARGLVITFH